MSEQRHGVGSQIDELNIDELAEAFGVNRKREAPDLVSRGVLA